MNPSRGVRQSILRVARVIDGCFMRYRSAALEVAVQDHGNAARCWIAGVDQTTNRTIRLRWMVENSFHVCGKIVEKMLHYVASFISYSQLKWSLAQSVDRVTE
jgi:hypothetical protein